ncbi:MAG: DEAD/DEAH box helicase [Bacteroidales bacterium]|nr:DEAD/DEAH box helicase [Bacteroidales bacterium]
MGVFKLVFAIVRDPDFQWMIEPYAVEILRKGLWSYRAIRISPNNINTYLQEYSDAEYEAVRILYECRPEFIVSHFTRGQVKMYDFFNQLPDNEKLFKDVVSYLRKKTDAAIQILSEYSIPLFYRGEYENIIQNEPIFPSKNILKANFYFQYDGNQLVYQLTLKNNDQDLNLRNGNTIILNYEPCWIIHNTTFYRVEANVDGKKLQPFLERDKIIVPSKQVDAYLQKFVKKILLYHDPFFSGIKVNYIRQHPQLCLFLNQSPFFGYSFSVQFNYQGQYISPFHEERRYVRFKKQNSEYFFEVIERDFQYEKKMIAWLEEIGLERIQANEFLPVELRLKHENYFSIDFLHELINYINQIFPILEEKNVAIVSAFEKSYYWKSIELKQDIKKFHDWFDLHMIIKLDDDTWIPFTALRKNILNNEREYILPDGRVFVIPAAWFSKFKDVFLLGKVKKDNVIEITKSNVNLLISLEDENSGLMIKSRVDFSHIPILSAPSSLKKTLRPYQLYGMSWFYFLASERLGGCLSDDMGLGKTIQVLAFLSKVKKDIEDGNWKDLPFKHQNSLLEEHSSYPSLIVVPLSIVHNWVHEINSSTSGLKYVVYAGVERHQLIPFLTCQDIVLTTYGTLRNDIELLANIPWLFVILDESQYIKNPTSKIYASVLKLKARARFVLTGTPIENKILDLWAQLNFVNPGMLGDLQTFKHYFSTDPEKEDRIKKTIRPFVLRRSKEQVAPELPPLTEKIHYCMMTEEQEKVYEIRKSEIRNYLLENKNSLIRNKTYMIVLSGLMKLRLIANHPTIVDKSFQGESGKFVQVVEHIKKALEENHRIIIFSQFVKHLQIYTSYFEKQDIRYLLLTGQTPSQQRGKMVELFQTGEIPLFFMSLKAGGFGLNLTAADYVFMLDPWWNPAVENQAINRTHRIGQDKNIIAYKFITKNTIEEKIVELQKEKKALFDKYLNDDKTYPLFSYDELIGLLEN